LTAAGARHVTYDDLLRATRAVHLEIAGAFHPLPNHGCPNGTGTLILLAPHEPAFWPAFTVSPEYRDTAAEPMDRWSRRIIGQLASEHDGVPLFPFGGAPYQPFLRWAAASGRAWSSPVGLLVHDMAGLFISYRGAVALQQRIDLPPVPDASPCESCTGQPCRTACPVGALGAEGYDVPACRAHIAGSAGQDCVDMGCAVRRACPISQAHDRLPAQSAFHMKAFQ